jgi:hypothetical protein
VVRKRHHRSSIHVHGTRQTGAKDTLTKAEFDQYIIKLKNINESIQHTKTLATEARDYQLKGQQTIEANHRQSISSIENIVAQGRESGQRIKDELVKIHETVVKSTGTTNLCLSELRTVLLEQKETRDLNISAEPARTLAQGSREHDILREAWESESRRLAVSNFQPIAAPKTWKDRFTELQEMLPRHLQSAPQLRGSLDHLLEALRQIDKVRAKISSIEIALSPAGSERNWSDFHLRDFGTYLSMLADTEEGRQLQRFRLEEWVREKFRGFADSFYQELSRRQLAGDDDGLKEAEQSVAKILSWGQLQVIPIRPGLDTFDSSKHLSRSSMSDPKFGNGVIVSVVRTGFKDLKTDKPLQAPEVIVNRR